MRISSFTEAPARPAFAQVVIGMAGALHLLTGVALLFAPAWFFAIIGTFPPFNRHYEGDLGAYLLPLGFGLLVAARAPVRHKTLIGVAALANLLHAFNHVYDAVIARAALGYWLRDTAPLLLLAALLVLAYRSLR